MKLPFIKFSQRSVYSFFFKKMNVSNKLSEKLSVQRAATIQPLHVNSTIYVHQGRTWVRLKITHYSVGYKAGMFAATKKPFFFKSKKKKGR